VTPAAQLGTDDVEASCLAGFEPHVLLQAGHDVLLDPQIGQE
jgi:hypothetical protein